jgi:hypothetical protein
MKKNIMLLAIALLGIHASQVQAEPNVYSYTYLPRGTTSVALTADSHPMGENDFSVELLEDNQQGQIISIFNTSTRDSHHYDDGETVSFFSLNRIYKTNRDDRNWIGLYASASKQRDYTLLTTNPDSTFTAVDQEKIKTSGSSEIKKVLRWKVSGSGHVKIRIPFYMRIFERGVLINENWNGTGRYINTMFGTLTQDYGSYSTDIDHKMIEQQSIHERLFDVKSGQYKVSVLNKYLTDDGLQLPATGSTADLRNYKRGVFILDGHVNEGFIKVELTLNTLAFLDYSIDLAKY